MKYRREVDGLRALAVLSVIFFHAGLKSFSGGYVGVDIFFVISGYLITTIIISEKEKQEFSITRFYERRARRILPALFFVMLFSLPFAWMWLPPKHLKDFSHSLVAVSSFASNFLFYKESSYFATDAELKPLLHTWSLAVEEQYYLLFPLFIVFMWRFRKKWIFIWLVLIASCSLTWAHWGAYNEPSSTFFLLHTRAWELAIGALIAFYLYYKKGAIYFSEKHCVREIISLAGLLMIGYSVYKLNNDTPFPSLYALLPTIGTGLIILFANASTWVGRFLGTKAMVGIGLISYSTYLWHQPLFVFTRHVRIEEPTFLLVVLLCIASIALGFLSWRLIEVPFRDRDLISRKNVFRFSLIASFFFIAIGFSGHLTDGYRGRYDATFLQIANPVNGQDQDCEEKKKKNGVTCYIGDTSTSPTVALLGDSHSTRFTKILSERLADRRQSMAVYAQPWGVPLLDVGTSTIKKRPHNREFMEGAFSQVCQDANIKTVILSAEWANYTKGMRFGEKKPAFYSDESTVDLGLEENAKVFTRGLKRTIDALIASNKKIIVIGSVPEYEVMLPDFVSKVYDLEKQPEIPERFTVSYEKYIDRNREVLVAFENADIYNKATFINPYDILCPANECRYIDKEENVFYIDNNHLSYHGSVPIAQEILKNL